jgi:adhesin transport system outer membrane protein
LQQGQERLAIQNNGLKRLVDYEGMVERRLATQVSSQNDVSLVKSRIEQLRSDIAATEAALVRARSTTSELTAVVVERVQPLGDSGWDLARGQPYWTQLVLDASPELASARNQVVAVETEILLRRAETKPRVLMRVESIHSPTTAGTSTSYTQAYVTIEAALTNGLSQFDVISQLFSRREAAQRQVEAAERSIRQQVQSVWADMAALSGQVPAIERVIKNNEDVVESFVRQYVAGRKSWLDVLNSERELLQSRLSAADLRSQSASAALRAGRLSGSLAQTAWQPTVAPVPGAAGRSGAVQ